MFGVLSRKVLLPTFAMKLAVGTVSSQTVAFILHALGIWHLSVSVFDWMHLYYGQHLEMLLWPVGFPLFTDFISIHKRLVY